MDDALLSKKEIKSVLTLDFSRRLFFGRGEFDEHNAIDCRFDFVSNW